MAHQIPQERIYGNFKKPLEERKREPSWRKDRDGNDDGYRKLIKCLPCCACPAPAPSDPHHLKQGTGETGMALRSTDRRLVPLCRPCHDELTFKIGTKNEHTWFNDRGIAPLTLAAALWQNKHDIAAMYKILIAHRDGTHEKRP